MQKYKAYFSNNRFLGLTALACCLLLVSLFANFYAGVYATERASSPVTDVVLSNIRTFDIDGFFIYGSFALWIFALWLFVREPKRIPFTIFSVALFTLIRSVFISLTHIGPYPTQIAIDSYVLSFFVLGGDLFFSGHTGLPFLLALIFWEDRPLRYFFIVSSVVFGTIVLLGHLHYSIDVLGAFFITYAIYRMCEIFFPSAHKIFKEGL